MTSEENRSIKSCKKSPSQLKRDALRKQQFIESKSQTEAPTSDEKAGEPNTKQEAEKDIGKDMKKALKVNDTEKEVTSFLDNLLKPKVPDLTKITTEVNRLKCDSCKFVGRSQQDLKRHMDEKHRGKIHSSGEKTNSNAESSFNWRKAMAVGQTTADVR